MKSPVEKFRSYLESRGMRLTREREFLVDFVATLPSPFTGDSVIDAIARIGKGPPMSRSVVYRTLLMLVDAGLLSSEGLPDYQVQFHCSYQSRGTVETTASNLCQSTHSSLIAGRCPWCGRQIMNGKPTGDDRLPRD